MKNLIGTVAIFATFILLSCNGNPETKEKSSVENEQSEMVENTSFLDLTEYGINGNMAVPQELSAESKISENAYGGLEIRAGKDYLLELLPLSMSIEEKKQELANNPVYKISYIEEGQDYLFYKKEITDSGVDEEYHLYMLKDFGNGEVYVVKTLDMESLPKAKVEKMLSILKNSNNQI